MASNSELEKLKVKAISQPLVSHIYTADLSAQVFNRKIYIYPSHCSILNLSSNSIWLAG